MKTTSSAFLFVSVFLGMALSASAQQPNYFKQYGSKVAVVAQRVGSTPKPMQLLSIDAKLGKLFCNIPEVGQVNYELSRLADQKVQRFDYTWPKRTRQALMLAADEQYDKIPEEIMAKDVRPVMYPLLHYLEVPNKYLNVHEQCLAFVRLLVAKKQYPEVLMVLGTINLNALEKVGYREFSDVALELVAKVISINPAYVAPALKLLAKVNVRPNNGNDHEAMSELGDSLRKLNQFSYAIQVYNRLATIMAPLPASPIKERTRLWPVYCYFKVYSAYSKKPDAASQKAASQYLNAARSYLAAIDKKPPLRSANEFSLYKLLRAILYLNYARIQEQRGATEAAESYYNQSVIEVTEGIVSSRVGLDWLPEALLMAAHGYEKLEAADSAKNIYRQMTVFYKGTNWATIANKRLGTAP